MEENLTNVKENENEKKESNKKEKNNKSIIKYIILVVILILVIMFLFKLGNKDGDIKIVAKTTLDRVVKKSDLETVNYKYNVIAKQCLDNKKCNLKSNNINNFKYVVSCQGTVIVGIDFKKVNVDFDKKKKTLNVTLPKSEIKEVNLGSIKFLNGSELPGNEFPEARNLCEKTIKMKSNEDKELIKTADDQAKVVLQSFYSQWIKAFNKDYKVEVK